MTSVISDRYFKPSSIGMLYPLSSWLDDSTVTELLINKPGEVWVESNGSMKKYAVAALTRYYLSSLVRLIANENKQQLSSIHPLLSGSLSDGSRVQIVLPPVSNSPAISIRRQVNKSMCIDDYALSSSSANASSMHNSAAISDDDLLHKYADNKEWLSLIKLAVRMRKNIIISGGTSTGKTTLLNALLAEIPLGERIITLEDTRELILPHENQLNLIAIKSTQQDSSSAVVSMQDLVQCCLRLRPDRIIMGEIRGAEIMDFLAASATGHDGSITCLHASSPLNAINRMMQMYKLNLVPSMTEDDIKQAIYQVVDIIIQLKRTINGRFLDSVYLC